MRHEINSARTNRATTARPSRSLSLLTVGTTASILAALFFFAATPPTLAAPTPSTGFSQSAAVGVPLPLAGVTVPGLIGKIINQTLGFAGLIALLMFIYGGLTWMLASGNEDKIGTAKKTVTWAALGLIMVFASYMIANLVITSLSAETMDQPAATPATTTAPAAPAPTTPAI
ncbi:MAG: pilin [Patescibacteria group bacterium]|jgi:hypothetical protein